MPIFTFRCQTCGTEADKYFPRYVEGQLPNNKCPDCGHINWIKGVASVSFSLHNSIAENKAKDSQKEEKDLRVRMKEEVGAAEVHPLAGNTIKSVWQDVEKQKSFIKENFAKTAEENKKKSLAKQKEWTEAASKRTPARYLEKQENLAKEKQAKERIVL